MISPLNIFVINRQLSSFLNFISKNLVLLNAFNYSPYVRPIKVHGIQNINWYTLVCQLNEWP